MRSYGVELAGLLAFNGNIRGSLKSPNLNGKFSVGTLIINGTELGALAASIAMNDSEINIPDGSLAERDGGGVQFSLVKPRIGDNNMSITAKLDRFSARNLLALSPVEVPPRLTADSQSDISGDLNVSGIPDAMRGDANLQFGPGKLGGEPLESLVARARFDGPNVYVDSVDVRLSAGRIVASITSLRETTQQAGQAGYPSFFMKEATDPGAVAPRLTVVLSACAQGDGDINCDGLLNDTDLSLFVGVLLGTETDSNYVTRSDLNNSGTQDGLDISPFTQAYLMGP